MLKLQFFTSKKYSEAWSVVNHCIFFKAQWFHCTSTVLPLYVFAVYDTLYNVILRIARNFLETRENIKISTHPFYHINLEWFSWEWSKKKKKFEKKILNGRRKKTEFFKIANSQKNFVKISQIGPWVSRIDWCEGHWCGSTYMAERLSNISSKTG